MLTGLHDLTLLRLANAGLCETASCHGEWEDHELHVRIWNCWCDVFRESYEFTSCWDGMGIHCILYLICGLLYFHFLNVILSLVFYLLPKRFASG